MNKTTAGLCLVTFNLGAAGCVMDEAEVEEEIATVEDQIVGYVQNIPVAGVVRVAVSGQSDSHTGVIVASNATDGWSLVLTSQRWATWQTTPANVTVEAGRPGSNVQTRTARHLNTSAYFPGTLIQVGAITNNPTVLDARSSANLVGVVLRCYEFTSATNLRYVDVHVDSTQGDSLTAGFYSGSALQDADAGAPCLDLQTGTVVAFATGATSSSATLRRIASLDPWFDGMENLASVRADNDSARLALYTDNGTEGTMCFDIPWGSPYSGTALNQYACHYGPSQRFWLDYRVDSSRPRIVSEASGLCLDVPSGSTASGVNLQQYPCHSGLNQRWDLSLWWDQIGGWKIRPAHALAQCVSVQGGPGWTSAPIEQRTCDGGFDQRWYPNWNPVYQP